MCVLAKIRYILKAGVKKNLWNRQVKSEPLRSTSNDQDKRYYFLFFFVFFLGTFNFLFCKYPQLHYFIKWQQKTTAGQTLFRTLSLHIYGGGNIYLDRDMENWCFDPFPKGTGCTLWFYRMPPGIKLICTFNNSALK